MEQELRIKVTDKQIKSIKIIKPYVVCSRFKEQ